MAHSHLDEKFAQFARTGDRKALEFVFVHTEERLRHRAQRLLGDARAAEDLVQELFLALLLRCDTYAPGRPCLPYLIGALHRRASTWQKRRALLQRLPVGPAGDRVPTADDVPLAWAGFRELVAAVQTALPQLPFASQDVVRRFLQDHESPQEIGRALGRPAGTVRVQLHRGLQLLRDLLPSGFFALPFLLLLRETNAQPPLPVSSQRLPAWLLTVTIAAGALACLPAFAPLWSAQAPVGTATAVASSASGGTTAPPAGTERALVTTAEAAATGSATLRFHHQDGTAASGVGVWFARAGTDPDFGGRRCVTDAEGRVALSELPAGELVVTTDRGTKTTIAVRAGVHWASTVELPAGVLVAGRVVDDDGAPVAGAGVWLCHSSLQPWDGQVVAHSEPDGTFALRDVAAMSTLAAFVDGRVPSPMLVVGGKPRAPLELRVGGPASTVAGTVVDEAGEPVRGAVVRVAHHARAQFTGQGPESHAELQPCRELRTGEGGHFVSGELPRGRLEVSVRAFDHAPALVPVHVDAHTQSVRVVLRRGAALRGTVRSAAGNPVAGATVVAHGGARHQWSAVDVSESGAFVLGGLDPARIVLEVRAPGFAALELPVLVPHREELAIVLTALPLCRGRFLDASGRPADAAAWELGWRQAGDGPDTVSPQLVPLAAGSAFQLEAKPGVLFFGRPRDDKVWLPCATETAADGQLVVRLPELPADRGVLQVRLHGATPEQLADSCVLLERDGEIYRGSVMPADSVVRLLATVPIGNYRVHVFGRRSRCPALFAGVAAVTTAGATLDVTVPPAGTLRYALLAERPTQHCGGFVVDEHGVQVPLREPAGSLCLAEGRYEFWAHGASFMTVRGLPFEVRAGQQTELDVPIRAGLVRHIAFSLPAGVSPDAARVQMQCHGNRVLGGEPGVDECGFDAKADGSCCVPIVLADDDYTLELRAGERVFTGRFAVAGEDGSVEPVVVALVETARGG